MAIWRGRGEVMRWTFHPGNTPVSAKSFAGIAAIARRFVSNGCAPGFNPLLGTVNSHKLRRCVGGATKALRQRTKVEHSRTACRLNLFGEI